MAKKTKPGDSGDSGRGPEAFRERYAGIFGERWPSLEAALAAEPDSVAFRSEALAESESTEPYYMDSASIFAALSLDLPGEGRILDAPGAGVHILDAPGASCAGVHIFDACAAPGGKTLVLASRLASGMSLVANELSADRRRRLRDVLDRHLSPALRMRVQVTGRDAASLCRSMPAAFDAILLDAPCSSERHVMADATALARWSPARIRGLAVRQWALLSSALIMLKAGGCLVYSTCALGPEENDRIAARAAAKHGGGIAFDRPAYPGPGEAEATEYGVAVLPDRARGAGPMYVCRIRKL